MADLKLGSQIGGNLIWHQGILELNPVDDKLNYRDQEILTNRGFQTVLGTMKFGTTNAVHDIENLSTDTNVNSRNNLRKFRAYNAGATWHESVVGDNYYMTTGINGENFQMAIRPGRDATFQYPVYTNSPQSTLANSLARKDYVDAIDAKNVECVLS